ncbi:hypothetical protein [Calothrix rhizosoleniae]|nr:hypothetical protein [Calothrix rhizosoleniae]
MGSVGSVGSREQGAGGQREEILIVNHQPPTTNHQPPTTNHQPSTNN